MGSTADEVAQRYAHLGTIPPAELSGQLESFAVLLRKWQRVQNLVSRETLDDLWQRHVADSLQLLKFVRPDDCAFLDLGSGGGFPALPLAMALRGRDGVSFLLVEPNARKSSFLRTVGRELGLPVMVEAKRSKEIDSRETLAPDVITSRALAPLVELCRLAAPFFAIGTRALFHKGREHVEELVESRAVWQHDVLIHPSDTSTDGVVLELRNLRLRNS